MFGLLEKNYISNDATDNAWFLCAVIHQFAREWSAPFSCSWGTEGSLTGSRLGAHHTPQPGWPPSSGTWGSLLFPHEPLAGANNQSGPHIVVEGIVLLQKGSCALPVKMLCSHSSTTFRCIF
jgi:hypothetical protein